MVLCCKLIDVLNELNLIKSLTIKTFRKVLREIKSKEIFNIIVDTDRAHIQLFFRNLLQLQMNNDKVSGLRRCDLILWWVLYSITTPSLHSMSRHWILRISNTTMSTLLPLGEWVSNLIKLNSHFIFCLILQICGCRKFHGERAAHRNGGV